jgi:hypothetical protein
MDALFAREVQFFVWAFGQTFAMPKGLNQSSIKTMNQTGSRLEETSLRFSIGGPLRASPRPAKRASARKTSTRRTSARRSVRVQLEGQEGTSAIGRSRGLIVRRVGKTRVLPLWSDCTAARDPEIFAGAGVHGDGRSSLKATVEGLGLGHKCQKGKEQGSQVCAIR